jgi:hypothetical protein
MIIGRSFPELDLNEALRQTLRMKAWGFSESQVPPASYQHHEPYSFFAIRSLSVRETILIECRLPGSSIALRERDDSAGRVKYVASGCRIA